jgi:6-phosphogluconolactonase (cycloisomerase 2 family)
MASPLKPAATALTAVHIWLAALLAIGPFAAATMGQKPAGDQPLAVYAGVGEELITFNVDVERGTLTRAGSTTLPGFVQEAWVSSSLPIVYVTWSNGGASYSGSGIAPRGNRHGITAFRIDSAGALHEHGPIASLRSRAIHITGDARARHLLVAYNDPSGVSVHAINNDGTIGSEIPQSAPIDAGIYGHQVRVFPANDAVVLVTRGNEPTSTTKEDPGALKVFRYDDGQLSAETSIAESKGIGFRSRHLDFHPTAPWVYLTLEAQNKLLVYRRTDRGLSEHPLFARATLADGTGVKTGQTASTVHMHPNGRFVYVGNRGGTAGTTNNIAVFSVDPASGEPTLIQNVDTQGSTPRTFSIDPGGRILIVGNQTTTSTSPANLAVFRIRPDGRLDFVRNYPVAIGQKPLWWMGIAAIAAR